MGQMNWNDMDDFERALFKRQEAGRFLGYENLSPLNRAHLDGWLEAVAKLSQDYKHFKSSQSQTAAKVDGPEER